jgi:hypothetical protein
MPTSKSRHANKADNHGLTGMATLQQMSGFIRDAPRGRRSISQALKTSRRTQKGP